MVKKLGNLYSLQHHGLCIRETKNMKSKPNEELTLFQICKFPSRPVDVKVRYWPRRNHLGSYKSRSYEIDLDGFVKLDNVGLLKMKSLERKLKIERYKKNKPDKIFVDVR